MYIKHPQMVKYQYILISQKNQDKIYLVNSDVLNNYTINYLKNPR